MTKQMIYKAEDIFQDIEGDDKNTLMTIPPEIMEKMGWGEGDVIKIVTNSDGTITITKKEEDAEEQ
jgi:bifunctional DNA-binding transcriptional regulator/antitoxin component of YhaV-PrlF toxin-antitoxin module